MAKVLVKLYDNEVDLEEFILINEEIVDEVTAILEEYRKSDQEYNIDGLLELLDANGIDYESLPVQNVYF